MPVASGIQLVPTCSLPDRTRPLFPFPFFNAIQSKCFNTIYNSSDNFVLSAPTASGKTVILELAICRFLVNSSANPGRRFKAVYQAPTKALCSERCRDWKQKFSNLNLQCEELTGDTEQSEVKTVQKADIIVTTPEKWDSVTRKWKDQQKLMELVKLFLIDEVHILKEDRGATLEAVVSRMRSVGQDIRFVALSATVPNSEDIAAWLGRGPGDMHNPAAREVFGEEFRPVRLEKHVLGLQASNPNEFAFDQTCNKKLPEVIAQYSKGKPIMIFCISRNQAQATAVNLANWWSNSKPPDRFWDGPRNRLNAPNGDLAPCVRAAVGFHHAGLNPHERQQVEQAFITGDINVLCCTATLAVGVNLPCHLVIIKNTVCWDTESASCVEYSDLDMMQMLGRAGRPQFDKSAVAVIMTKREKTQRYERMVQGQALLESRLHLNLIEHFNSEITLGTIYNLMSARQWLESTFLFVRLARNPGHYKIEGDVPGDDLRARAERICQQALVMLQRCVLISGEKNIQSTELGGAMARCLVKFTTMKLFLGLQRAAKTSEILSAVAQASELQGCRFKSGEKAMYKDINSSNMTRFPIKVHLDLPGHKVSLIIQAILGGRDMSSDKRFNSHHIRQFTIDKSFVFQHVRRLLRCLIDCQIHFQDAVSARAAMALARSVAAEAWDDMACQLAQIEQIGPVSVRKLAGAQIRTVEELESCEPHRIEMILSRNPPFGTTILNNLRDFPRLRVSLKAAGGSMRAPHEGVEIKVSAELGFLNDRTPTQFRRTVVHVCFLAETSNGRLIHFCRTSASRLVNNPNISFTADLHDQQQMITAYVSCDDIAGTLTYASLDPKVPAAMFSKQERSLLDEPAQILALRKNLPSTLGNNKHLEIDRLDDEIGDDDLFDTIDDSVFVDIDDISSDAVAPQTDATRPILAGKGKARQSAPISMTMHGTAESIAPRGGKKQAAKSTNEKTKTASTWQPERLSNGNWNCNHRCKDKQVCKHNCCRQGTESKPKPPKNKKEEPEESTIMAAFRQRVKSSSATANVIDPEPSNREGHATDRKIDPLSATSSTAYYDEDDMFNDIDKIAIPNETSRALPRPFKGFSPEKGRSLFTNDTSSPQKSSSPRKNEIEEIDLSSNKPRYAPWESGTNVTTKARRRAATPMENGSKRSRLSILNNLESVIPTTMSQAPGKTVAEMSSAQHSTEFWPTQPWSQEAEDLFGTQQFNHHAVASMKNKGTDLHSGDPGEYELHQNERHTADDDNFQNNFGSDDLLNCADRVPLQGRIPSGKQHHVPEVESAAQDEVAASSKIDSEASKSIDGSTQDEIDAFIMQEFGHCVNFV